MPIIFTDAEPISESLPPRKRLGRPPVNGEKLDVLVPVKVTPSMYDALDKSVRKRHTTVSALTRAIWGLVIAKDLA